MDAQKNKILIRRLYDEVYAKWNLGLLDEFIGADFIGHRAAPGTRPEPAGVRQFYTWNFSAGNQRSPTRVLY